MINTRELLDQLKVEIISSGTKADLFGGICPRDYQNVKAVPFRCVAVGSLSELVVLQYEGPFCIDQTSVVKKDWFDYLDVLFQMSLQGFRPASLSQCRVLCGETRRAVFCLGTLTQAHCFHIFQYEGSIREGEHILLARTTKDCAHLTLFGAIKI